MAKPVFVVVDDDDVSLEFLTREQSRYGVHYPRIASSDPWGFVLTGPDTGEGWTQERPPFLLETSLPGVFAVGDVRHGSVKRVASAVVEGSIVIRPGARVPGSDSWGEA